MYPVYIVDLGLMCYSGIHSYNLFEHRYSSDKIICIEKYEHWK